MYDLTYVLGIDQAARSGWGIAPTGQLVVPEHGIVQQRADARISNRERLLVVQRAIELAGGPDKLLVVFEDHSKMSLSVKTKFDPHRQGRNKKPTRTVSTYLGMGAAKARWMDRLDDCDHPERLRIAVTMDDWRMRVLGLSRFRGRLNLEAAAKQWASGIAGAPITDDNEAEAMGITAWGAIDGVHVWLRLEADRRQKVRDASAKRKQQKLVVNGEEIAE